MRLRDHHAYVYGPRGQTSILSRYSPHWGFEGKHIPRSVLSVAKPLPRSDVPSIHMCAFHDAFLSSHIRVFAHVCQVTLSSLLVGCDVAQASCLYPCLLLCVSCITSFALSICEIVFLEDGLPLLRPLWLEAQKCCLRARPNDALSLGDPGREPCGDCLLTMVIRQHQSDVIR